MSNSEYLQRLKQTAIEGNIEVIRATTPDDCKTLIDNRFLLGYATAYGHLDVVKLLVEEKGVDVNDRSIKNMTALYTDNKDVVEYLLEQGADPYLKDKHGLTIVHRMAQDGNVELLDVYFSYGVDINITDEQGETPLHHAVAQGKLETVKFLVEKGADKTIVGMDGLSPKGIAYEEGHDDIIRYFNGEVIYDDYDDDDENEYDGKYEDEYCNEEFPENCEVYDSTTYYALYQAISIGDLEEVKSLISPRNGGVNQKDNFGRSLLYWASYFDEVEIVKYLIKHGAVVNAYDVNGCGSLLMAARSISPESAKILIENGADVNKADIFNEIALLHACEHDSKDSKELKDLLIDNGARLDERCLYWIEFRRRLNEKRAG